MQSTRSTRGVQIEIWNKSSCKILNEPEKYIHNGQVDKEPSGSISQGKRQESIFIKAAEQDGNVAGVLSYRFGGTRFSLLVSNTYVHKTHRFKYALFFPNKTTPTDNQLYHKMDKEEKESDNFIMTMLEKGQSTSGITKRGIHVSATMSNEKKVILEIEIRDA